MALPTAKASQTIDKTGTTWTYWTPDAVNGNKIPSGTKTLEVVNGAGAPITCTIAIPGTINGRAITSRIITITNGTRKEIPIYPYYAQSDGTVLLTWSSSSSITAVAKVV